MSNEMRCPDCGGIVGATQPSDEGPPCTCFGQPGFKNDPNDPSNTQVLESPSKQKVCCKCGKDLTGKKRMKDSVGYWCPDCARQDKDKQKEPGTVACKRCGRAVKEETLEPLDGQMVCSRCAREERELKRPGSKRFRAVDSKQYQKHEKRNLIIMGVVLAVLAILILLSRLHVIGG